MECTVMDRRYHRGFSRHSAAQWRDRIGLASFASWRNIPLTSVNCLTAGFQLHPQSALFCRPDRNNITLLFGLGMSFTLMVAVRSARELAQIDVDDRGCE
jgi:hypothetical protein